MPARILSMRIQASAGHIAAVLIRSLSFLTSSLPLQLFARQCLRSALLIFACAFRCHCSQRIAAALPCTSVLLSAVAGLIYPTPPRCRAGLFRCFSVRLSAAAQVGPAHCLCAADLTFAFAVLSCARPLLFCPHLCRCCSLPSMAFLCRRVSALISAAAARSRTLPCDAAAVQIVSVPPLVSAVLLASFPPLFMAFRLSAAAHLHSALPVQINTIHIMASAARFCALLTLPPLRHAKLRVSMPPLFVSVPCIPMPLLIFPALCLCLSQRDSAFPLLVLP